MLTWFAFSLALSAAIIFVVHRLYRFFIQALTCPIEKDIAGSTFDEYKNMYCDIHRGMMAGSSVSVNTNGIDTDGVGAASAASASAASAAAAVAPTNVAPDANRSGGGSVFDDANATGFGGTPFDAEMEPYVRNMSHTYNNINHNNNNNNHVPEQSCDALDHRPSRGMMSELNDFIQTNRRLEPALDAREPESFRF